MSEALNPETPEAVLDDAADQADEEEPIKQRKNGLYPGVSDELAESMKSGWADTELHDLEPIAQAATPPPAAPRSPRASRASAW